MNSSFLHSTFITFIPRVTYMHVQLYTVYFGGPLHLKRAIPNAHRLWTDVINLCYTVASYPKGYNDETIRMLQSIIHVLPIAYPFAQCFIIRGTTFSLLIHCSTRGAPYCAPRQEDKDDTYRPKRNNTPTNDTLDAM